MKRYLLIWHKEKHTGGTVSEIHNTVVSHIIKQGGFFAPESKAFILLHNINWIEVVEEPAAPTPEKEREKR